MEGGSRRHLLDAYRHLHGYGRQEFSWFVKRGERRIGRRFDHVRTDAFPREIVWETREGREVWEKSP
jgi:exonuclease III